MLCTVCDKSEVPPRADNPHFPFCSQRCKAVDLGRWLVGDYAIPGPPVDLEDGFEAFPHDGHSERDHQEDDH